MEIEVRVADITALTDVDAIVNAANSALATGGGVCGAIFRAAGHERLQAACDALGGCPTGSARATPAFDLERRGIRWIIHAVGPVWHGGHQGEADLLAGAYRSALEEAARIGARRVAFPAISTGIYGYPPDEAARVAVATLRAFDGPVDAVVLTAHPASARHPWDAALATPP